MRKFLKNQKGVTMIEVLVTIAILAIVVTPCLSAFVMAQRGNVKAAETKQAYTAAANLMEELKGLADPEKIEDRLSNDYPVDDDVKVNKNDGIHVIYEKKTNYVEVWIYNGEADNKPKADDEAPSQDYLIKGVIAHD
jgi:prepilin-type N-terminal cleavage/methylation domain-containing protein